MRLPFRSSLSRLSHRLRELARQRPDEAEEYLDTHQDEWEAIAETDPGSAADILEALDEEDAADLLRDLDLDDGADVLDEMRAPAAADVIEEMRPERAAELVAEMETHQAVDLLAALEVEMRDAVHAALEPEVRLAINRLLVYPDDSAGGLMTIDYASLPVGITSGEAIESLRRLHAEIGSNLTYVYVVDLQGKLAGVAPFRELVFARPGTGLDEIMLRDPISVTVDTDREIVAELIQRYHLISLPVTDHQQHLVGIVKVDEAMEAVQTEATEDIAQMVGAGAEETVYTEVGVSVRRRIPWIALNLAIGLGLAVMIRGFESTIADRAVLASFMPMVALLGGNSGAQSLAVIIRAMAVGSVPPGPGHAGDSPRNHHRAAQRNRDCIPLRVARWRGCPRCRDRRGHRNRSLCQPLGGGSSWCLYSDRAATVGPGPGTGIEHLPDDSHRHRRIRRFPAHRQVDPGSVATLRTEDGHPGLLEAPDIDDAEALFEPGDVGVVESRQLVFGWVLNKQSVRRSLGFDDICLVHRGKHLD